MLKTLIVWWHVPRLRPRDSDRRCAPAEALAALAQPDWRELAGGQDSDSERLAEIWYRTASKVPGTLPRHMSFAGKWLGDVGAAPIVCIYLAARAPTERSPQRSMQGREAVTCGQDQA